MRLLTLSVRDFLPFEDLDLSFEGIEQLAVIGPNGSGKSSLQDAVLWSLYGKARGSSDECVREGALVAVVTTHWSHIRGRVIVSRTRRRDSQTTLRLSVAGVDETRHTIAETQQAIESLVGLSYEALLMTAFMVQGDSDALMAASPSERKELLASLFGLGRWERALTKVKGRLDLLLARSAVVGSDRKAAAEAADAAPALEEELGRLESLIEAQRAAVGVLDEQRTRLVAEEAQQAEQARQREALTKLLDKLLDEQAALQSEYDRFALDMRARLAGLQAPVPDPPEGDEQELRTAVDEAEARDTERTMIARQRYSLEGERHRVESQAQLIEEVPCNGEGIYAACPLLVTAIRARDGLVTIDAQLTDLSARHTVLGVSDIKQRRAELESLQQAQAEWRSATLVRQANQVTIGDATERDLDYQQRLVDLSIKLADLTLERDAIPILSLIPGFRTKVESDLTIARQALAALEVDRTKVSVAHEAALSAASKLLQLTADMADLEREREVLTVLQSAFGRDGIPLMVLENGIGEIEMRANELLERMPGSWQVAMITQRETKAGELRDTLDVSVRQEGVERPYRMFSGGQRFRVDFALRVSLASVLAARTGISFATLWLDEGFGTQDPTGIEALLEAIGAVVDEFGLIVCVSHLEAVVERFGDRLRLSTAEGVSTASLEGVA